MMEASYSTGATTTFDLVLCLAQAVDLVSPLVADHHRRVAQITYSLGRQIHLPEDDLVDLVIAAALHDVGGLTRTDRLDALDFEYQDPYGHAVMGYLLLKPFAPFENSAQMVRFHHVAWQNGAGAQLDGVPVPTGSHLLQLADRVAVLIDPQCDVLEQAGDIVGKISAQAGERFVPQQVEAFKALAQKEAFWLDTVFLQDLHYLNRNLQWRELEISSEHLRGLGNLFRRVIDFRSRFTAGHSAGVAATAEALARLCGFSEENCRLMNLAGLLHDLGKLAVPAEILEKPDKLTREEYAVMRRHTYYTYHILEPLKMLNAVTQWGAFHHERIDGQGYPFHLRGIDLPLGARIVSVADIFTALTEDRPYRKGLGVNEALKILSEAARRRQVDGELVAVVRDHFDELNQIRCNARQSAQAEYCQFVETTEQLTHRD